MANELFEKKDFKFTIQDEPDDEGTFRGRASVFGALDSYGEMVDAGAFKKTLKENKKFPLLDTHDPMRRLGVISGIEDGEGLLSEGHLNMNVQAGREARALAIQGAFNGLSIGFQTLKEKIVDGVRHLKEIKLWEISLCVFQACPGALVADVKSIGVPWTIAAMHKALIGWTTDKEFKVSDDEKPMLISAGDSIKALLAMDVAPGASSPDAVVIEPRQDDGVLQSIAMLNDVLKKANQTIGGLNA